MNGILNWYNKIYNRKDLVVEKKDKIKMNQYNNLWISLKDYDYKKIFK